MSGRENDLQLPKSGRVTELFPYEMPFRAARMIAALLITFFGIVVVASVFIDYPETVNAPFILLPESGADPIQSAFDGVVEEVHAVVGANVKRGDLLYVVRSPRIQALSAELRTLRSDLEAVSLKKTSAEDTFGINREIQAAEIAQREKEAEYRRRYLDVYRDVNDRIEKLGKEGLSSSIEVLTHQLGHAEALRDAALASEEFKMAELALTRLEAEHRQEMEALDNEATKLQVRIDGLAGQLREVNGDLARLSAPCDGALVSVARQRVGDVVSVGQELCQIAPAGAPPLAHLQLEERGMAKLREGQPVKLLFEAFPYQRYGVIDGALTWLSPAPITAGGEAHFVAHVKPSALEIGGRGVAHPLKAGMRGEARVQVGRRTLIEYAFEPIRQLRENMRSPGQ
ncbi:MAG: HlyD family efflux transporter periplasmic adaptor subunit [Candidatus Hydrogenedentes bacterium]|nr:HlyD family efflux transporter periplasmic adaptor subunit [Candidatus Hydrogenedentota bacterium]